jgi:hypothetical protein
MILEHFSLIQTSVMRRGGIFGGLGLKEVFTVPFRDVFPGL